MIIEPDELSKLRNKSEKSINIEHFLEPGRECLVASDGADLSEQLRRLTRAEAKAIGQAALRRVLAEHTYSKRAAQVEEALDNLGSWENLRSSF